MRVFFLADRRLQGNRLLRDFQNLAHLRHGNIHALGDFLGSGFAAEFLHQLSAGADELVDRLDHVHGDADGAGLVGDGAGNGLADPPGCVRGKFVAAAPLEFVHGLHEADVALLNQVQELQSAIGVFFRDGDDEAKVGLDQFFFGLLGFGFSPKYHLKHALQIGEAGLAGNFNFAQLGAARAQFLARFGGVVALGGVGAALEFSRFAFEGLQALDRVADFVDEPFFLKQVELDRARQLRHLDAQAGNVVLQAQVGALLGLGHPLELHGFAQTFVVQLGDFVEDLERFLGLVFDLLFGQLFIVELDDFLDGTGALAEVVSDRQQFLQDDRLARDGFEDEKLPALDALGDGHFALARQERHGSHFAQVHAHRVVGLFQHSRREVQIAGVFRDRELILGFDFRGFRYSGIGGGAGGLGRGEVFVNVNSVFLEGGEKVVN